jgi:hypothetical protein
MTIPDQNMLHQILLRRTCTSCISQCTDAVYIGLLPKSLVCQFQVGFFADAGPLQLFVSNHLIPEDFEFNATGEPAFVSTDEAVRVQAGAEVRLRIVGTRMDASEIVSQPSPIFFSSFS